MEGIATNVISSSTGYGNHVYIQNGDVVTIYAHCKVLYVKAGEKVVKGQEIAEDGSTGNATGAHLHFEVIRDGRQVNPRLVINF